jgi:hypothetical protein
MALIINRLTWWATLAVVLIACGRAGVAIDHWSYLAASAMPDGVCDPVPGLGRGDALVGCAAVWAQDMEFWSSSAVRPFLPPYTFLPSHTDLIALVEWLPAAIVAAVLFLSFAAGLANRVVRAAVALFDVANGIPRGAHLGPAPRPAYPGRYTDRDASLTSRWIGVGR